VGVPGGIGDTARGILKDGDVYRFDFHY